MSLWEIPLQVQCPHCDRDSYAHAHFNEMEFGPEGGDSIVDSEYCSECNKKFYFISRLRFDVEVEHAYKKKPKGLK